MRVGQRVENWIINRWTRESSFSGSSSIWSKSKQGGPVAHGELVDQQQHPGADSDCQRRTVCRNSAISEGRQNVLERHRKYRSPRQVAQGVSNLDGHPVGSLRWWGVPCTTIQVFIFFLNNSQSPSASSQVIPHCCHRAHLEPVQVCSSEWWLQICQAGDRRVETLPLPKFSTAEKKCKLHQRLSKSRFKSKGGLVRKELSNPPTTHTWIAPHDMCMSVKSSLWFWNDDDLGRVLVCYSKSSWTGLKMTTPKISFTMQVVSWKSTPLIGSQRDLCP